MPRVNIFIRDEDWIKWQAIESKPDWLHEHLEKIEVAFQPITKVTLLRKVKHSNKPVVVNDNFSGPIPKSFSARRKK